MNAQHAARRPGSLHQIHQFRHPRRRGIAALTVVMILFFVMALVAAYTNRNLIFEQRIATNSYRANRALEAADAGVEWTVAMLNGGRIDANCQPSIEVGNSDFRHRYHIDAAVPISGENSGYEVVWGDVTASRMYPACINRNGVLSCICPSQATPNPAIGGSGDGLGSAFRIEFLRPGNAVRPGAIEFAARGCASLGEDASACVAQTHNTLPTVDGLSGALTTVGLVRALPVPPAAALTAGTSIEAAAGELRVSNADAATGVTVHAGTAINLNPGASNSLAGPAGSLSDGKQGDDASLNALAIAADDRWFRAMFGQYPKTYQRQPAVIRIDCTGGCTAADLGDTLLGYPRNPIWVTGNLDLDTASDFGSSADPLMLIVTGDLTVSAGARITGFAHANRINWAAGAAGATVRGALVSATTFTAASRATLAYDRPVLDTISQRYGSFVRAPGSWNLIFR